MGVVKYTGPIASFHCPTNADIRSLKVHFSPKQLGEGTPSPENVREIVGWDGVEAYDYTKTDVNTAIIPSEYQKVEYLQGNSGPYINPNQLLYKGDVVNLKFKYDVTYENDVQWGYRYNDTYTGHNQNYINSRYTSYLSNRLIIAGVSANSVGSNTCFEVGVINNICLDTESEQIIVNGINSSINFNFSEGYAFTSNEDSGYPPYLFALNNCGTAAAMCSQSTKVYDYRVTRQGIDVIHLIPCLRKSDNKPGMYDTVSQTFYTNAGTGEFLYGPEVSGYTTNYEFGVLGKNKLDVSAYIDNEYVKSDGTFATNNSFRRTDYLHLASGNYVYSATKNDGTTAYVRVCGYDRSKAFVAQLGEQVKSSGNYEMAFTVPENVHYIILQSYKPNTNEQVELGSTATTYEPYDPNHTVYGGWVDLITGEVVVDTAKVHITSDLNITQRTPATYTGVSEFRLKKADNPIAPLNNTLILSNIFDTVFNRLESQNYVNSYYIDPLTLRISFYTSTEIDSVDKFKTFLDNNTLELCYKISPITYSLAPTQLQTFLGQNNVWSNADYVEVEYDLHETQNILARKQFIIANQPHIVKPAAAPIQTFTTDVVAPLKECKVHFGPVQEGTGYPSPDNIRAISGWNGIDIIRSGKNIFHTEWEQGSIDGSTGELLAADTRLRTKDYIKLKTGTRYVINITTSLADKADIMLRTFYMYNDNNTITNYSMVKASFPYVIVPQSDTNYVKLKIVLSHVLSPSTAQLHPSDITSTIIEATPLNVPTYEPYQGATLPIDWTTEAGTVYGGYVDLIKGEVVAEWEQKTISDLNWGYERTYSRFSVNITGIKQYPSVRTTPFFASCLMPIADGRNLDSVPNNSIYAGGNSNTVYIKCTDYDTKEAFIEAYGNQKFIYQLATPITYFLTPQSLKTLRGTNNIWSNANGDIEIQYYTH